MPPSYIISIPYKEFKENFCSDIMTARFNKLVNDGMIDIEYHYGPSVNWNTEIIWRIPNGGDFHKVRYGHSSPFAEWWCALTDESEENTIQEDTGYACKECGECGPHIIVQTDITPNPPFLCPDCKDVTVTSQGS
jgi:hypothetical protein